MNLCLNCLEAGGKGFPIGHEKGDQRDPYRETISLCADCSGALSSGNLWLFNQRFRAERVINNGGPQ
jgi:hypothetical protein